MPKLERYLKRAADDLPSLPVVAREVMRLTQDPESTPAQMVELIEQDAGIASRILTVSNSSLYGFPSQIKSLSHAVALLGQVVVRNLALAASMKSTFKRFGLMEKLLWEHSAIAGPVAHGLASMDSILLDADEAFTAGLLHDIGKTALANSHPDEYERVVARTYNEKLSYMEAETDFFGFDHAALGGRVAELWGLPPNLVKVIQHHHDHDALATLDEPTARMTALTSISTAVLTKMGVGRSLPDESIQLGELPAWHYLGLSEDDVEPVWSLCTERVKNSHIMIE